MSQNTKTIEKLNSKLIYKIFYKKREEQWEKLTDMMMNRLHNEEIRRKYLELELEKLRTEMYYLKKTKEKNYY